MLKGGTAGGRLKQSNVRTMRRGGPSPHSGEPPAYMGLGPTDQTGACIFGSPGHPIPCGGSSTCQELTRNACYAETMAAWPWDDIYDGVVFHGEGTECCTDGTGPDQSAGMVGACCDVPNYPGDGRGCVAGHLFNRCEGWPHAWNWGNPPWDPNAGMDPLGGRWIGMGTECSQC
jgi:hypothetical protein